MNSELKRIIENARPAEHGVYKEFLLVTTGKAYDGFFGENGYDNIIILARYDSDDQWRRLNDDSTDLLALRSLYDISIDVPSDLGCVRLFMQKPVHIYSARLSQVMGEGKPWRERGEWND